MIIILAILTALVLVTIVFVISLRYSDRKIAKHAAKASAGIAADLSVSNHHGGCAPYDCADGASD